mgnify:CR=1 FL=1
MSSTSLNILPTISKTKTRKNIREIHREYELMRKFIDEKKDSPNLFLNKLDNRFRMYFAKCKTYNDNRSLKGAEKEEYLGIDDILAIEDKVGNNQTSQTLLEDLIRFKKIYEY